MGSVGWKLSAAGSACVRERVEALASALAAPWMEEREQMNFTSNIDRQIVAGFWGDMMGMLRLLAEEGFSREAVLHRAEKIGLMTGRASRRPRLTGSLLVRECLRCDQVFVAEGHFNRLCRRCHARG